MMAPGLLIAYPAKLRHGGRSIYTTAEVSQSMEHWKHLSKTSLVERLTVQLFIKLNRNFNR